jgi:hypothetical protein
MNTVKSVGWGSALITYILIALLGVLAYAVLYLFTYVWETDYSILLHSLLVALPFAYVFLCFMLGLYFFSWYVDMHNLLAGFVRSPQRVLWLTITPIVQLYGIASSVHAVAKQLDGFSDDDRWYSLSQRVLTLLAALYAAVLAVGMALLFGSTLPATTEMVNQNMVTIFHISATVAGVFLLSALAGLILATQSITRQLVRQRS